MSKSAGYSGKPLAMKLGINEGDRVKIQHAPQNYLDLLHPLPANVAISNRLRGKVRIFHLFASKRAELKRGLQTALHQIQSDGMIWVSWPKQASGVPSEISEDSIRDAALTMGLVDVKVCAVDDVWSALKLVIRKSNRSTR